MESAARRVVVLIRPWRRHALVLCRIYPNVTQKLSYMKITAEALTMGWNWNRTFNIKGLTYTGRNNNRIKNSSLGIYLTLSHYNNDQNSLQENST